MEIKDIETGEIIKGDRKDMIQLLSSNVVVGSVNGRNVYRNKYIINK